MRIMNYVYAQYKKLKLGRKANDPSFAVYYTYIATCLGQDNVSFLTLC